MKKTNTALSMAFAALAATGCGSGGGSGDTSPTETSVSGTVADGYLNGATVCLDVNENSQCDDSDPQTTSGENGKYTLEGVTAEQKSEYAIVVEVTAGETLDNGAEVSQSYSLSGVPGEHEFVSPVTTMVNAKMAAAPNMSREEAKAQVASEIGKEPGDLLKDYVQGENSDENLHKIAQGIRKSVQEIEDQIKTDWQIDELSESDRKLLRYAVTKVVANHVSEISQQVGSGTDPESVSVTASSPDKTKTEQEKEANEEAIVQGIGEVIANQPKFVTLDLACDDCTSDSQLDANINFLSDNEYANTRLSDIASSSAIADASFDPETQEGTEYTKTENGYVQMEQSTGATLTLTNAMVVELKGDTLALDHAKLGLDSDIQDTFNGTTVKFGEGDKVIQWSATFEPGNLDDFSWGNIDSDVTSTFDAPNATSISDWVTRHNSDTATTGWDYDGQIFFNTGDKTVHLDQNTGSTEVGSYEIKEDSQGNAYLLIDTNEADFGTIVSFDNNTGSVQMTDYVVSQFTGNMRALTPSAAKKVVEAIKG